MARPKANQPGPSAQEKLAAAFWDMLEESSYASLTVSGLAKRAGVNHNTLYYYYDNIEDMANKLFKEDLLRDAMYFIPLLLELSNPQKDGESISAIQPSELFAYYDTFPVDDEEGTYAIGNLVFSKQSYDALSDRFRKIYAFLTSGSTYLIDLFKSTVKEAWLDRFNIDPESLDPVIDIQMEFLLSGLVSIYQSLDPDANFEDLIDNYGRVFLGTKLGQSILETLRNISHNGSNFNSSGTNQQSETSA